MHRWPRPSRCSAAAVTPAASSPATSGRPAPSTSRVTRTVATSPAASAFTVALVRVAEATISPSQRRASSSRITTASRSGSLSVSATRHARPAGQSVSSMPRTIGGRTGVVRAGTTTPTTPERRGRTRLAVGSAIRPGRAGFSARDAVAGWTPACSATSRIVGRRAMRARALAAAAALPDGLGRPAPRPVAVRRLAALEVVARLEAGRHRRARAGHDLVVLDVEQSQPGLLPERQADRAAELDQLRLAEVRVHALPERVVGVEAPRDRLGVGERRLLALVEAIG